MGRREDTVSPLVDRVGDWAEREITFGCSILVAVKEGRGQSQPERKEEMAKDRSHLLGGADSHLDVDKRPAVCTHGILLKGVRSFGQQPHGKLLPLSLDRHQERRLSLGIYVVDPTALRKGKLRQLLVPPPGGSMECA